MPSQLPPQWLCGFTQVYELPQSHCGDNWEGTLFSWLHMYMQIYNKMLLVWQSYHTLFLTRLEETTSSLLLHTYIYYTIYYIYFYTLYTINTYTTILLCLPFSSIEHFYLRSCFKGIFKKCTSKKLSEKDCKIFTWKLFFLN